MFEIAYVIGLVVGSVIRGVYTQPYKKITIKALSLFEDFSREDL